MLFTNETVATKRQVGKVDSNFNQQLLIKMLILLKPDNEYW